jgi:hypothetical protein
MESSPAGCPHGVARLGLGMPLVLIDILAESHDRQRAVKAVPAPIQPNRIARIEIDP